MPTQPTKEDASVMGHLEVRLNGMAYQANVPGSNNLQGGTTARLRPLRSGRFEFAADQGLVRLELIGTDLGLDVTANSPMTNEIDIGPTDSSNVSEAGAYARSAGFDRAAVQIAVRANSTNGSVRVMRFRQ